MKATSFLNDKRIVVVRVSDSTYHLMSETETERWISDMLRYVAGAGHPVRHIKDGEFSDGRFTNSVTTYSTRPYQEACRNPPVTEEPMRFEFAVDALLDVQAKLRHQGADREAQIADIEDAIDNLYAIREVCRKKD